MVDFTLKQGEFCGNPAILVTPSQLSVKWDKDNIIFRSSIWDMGGNLLSAGFKKFVNYGEKPEIFKIPISLKDVNIFDKIDGSCAIFDYYNNQISIRTRGTFSYENLENASDYKLCLELYPDILPYLKDNSHYTLLFEITTPNNKIVIDYGKNIDITLLGIVNKTTYNLLEQSQVDNIAKILKVKRPKRYTFKTISELVDTVTNLKGIEGVVLYTKNDQDLYKVKAAEYLMKHAFKEHASLESVIDLFLLYKYPKYEEFCSKITEQFDHECFQMVKSYISQIIDGYREVLKIEHHMQDFINNINNLPRKDQALKIISSYGNTNRSSYVFMKLDSKPFTEKEYKKLLWQILKQ